MDILHVVAGIIINDNNQILIAQRPLDKYLGGLWEFPGGKVEPSETPENALKREIREELDIEIINATSWLKIIHPYAKYTVSLETWLISHFLGSPKNQEGQTICWVKCSELSKFQFLEGNREIIAQLQDFFSQISLNIKS